MEKTEVRKKVRKVKKKWTRQGAIINKKYLRN